MRPNILFIMADDHAAKAISCYGAGLNHTPNLDRLHTNGSRLDSCYVTNSICTPSRATILTGTHNHVNCVHTLGSSINNLLPNVAKHLRAWGDYQTAMVGKWHLGEGDGHSPEGSFDYWDVIPGQGKYFDPVFIQGKERKVHKGYVTDIITDKSLAFIEQRDRNRPFFVMCHHKAPHRMWECDPKHEGLYMEDVEMPETFTDDYKNRARAASVAKMRVESDLTYADLGLVQSEPGMEQKTDSYPDGRRKIPNDPRNLRLVDAKTGAEFTCETREELSHFKYQRYLKRYLRTIQSIDDNVGRMLDYLEREGLLDNTYVIYTSDQGFFLGEHGWFDKRFIYEESFQMPFLIQGPHITPGSVCKETVSNVDFAATWLDLCGLRIPTYMQGRSFKDSLFGPDRTDSVAYHRYWMHADQMHNAYAHYGIRNDRYKIIFWYNLGYSLPGTSAGGEQQEWEFFDCQEDPMELCNLWADTTPTVIQAKEEMVRRLEHEMETIGDIPAHRIGLSVSELMAAYPANDIALEAKESQRNM